MHTQRKALPEDLTTFPGLWRYLLFEVQLVTQGICGGSPQWLARHILEPGSNGGTGFAALVGQMRQDLPPRLLDNPFESCGVYQVQSTDVHMRRTVILRCKASIHTCILLFVPTGFYTPRLIHLHSHNNICLAKFPPLVSNHVEL